MANNGSPAAEQLLYEALKALSQAKDRAQKVALIERVCVALAQAVGSERVGVFVHDALNDRAWLLAGVDMDSEDLDVPLRNSITGQVISSREVIMKRGLDGVNGVHQQVDALTGFSTREVLCAPIPYRSSRVAGAVQLLNEKRPGTFDKPEVRTLLVQTSRALASSLVSFYQENEAFEPESERVGWQGLRGAYTPLILGVALVLAVLAGLYFMAGPSAFFIDWRGDSAPF